MTLLLIVIHSIINIALGYVVLYLLDRGRKSKLWVVEAFLIGAFLETMIGFVFLMIGMSELYAFYICTAIAFCFILYQFFISKKLRLKKPKVPGKLKLFEVLLLIPIVAKVSIGLYQLLRFPIYFDDAMTHWSGRAHALYGKVNWSMDATSEFFLGVAFGFKEYPLFLVIWRSINAGICGGWNDVVARADSFIFYMLIMISIYIIIRKKTKKRWMALAAAFIISAVPLMHIHATSGYSEIAVCLVVLVIYNALTEGAYLKAGILTALCIWTKNEGLFLFFPIFAVCTLYVTAMDKQLDLKRKVISTASYCLSTMILISPWLIFKSMNGIPLSVISSEENFYHADSILLFLSKLFNSPSSNIFWLAFFVFIIIGFNNWRKQKEIVMGVGLILMTLSLLFYVFCFTDAHRFLINDMTAHRSLLQIAPIAVIVIIASVIKSPESSDSESKKEVTHADA